MTLYDAIKYDEFLGNGWRLPAIHELLSIFDKNIK